MFGKVQEDSFHHLLDAHHTMMPFTSNSSSSTVADSLFIGLGSLLSGGVGGHDFADSRAVGGPISPRNNAFEAASSPTSSNSSSSSSSSSCLSPSSSSSSLSSASNRYKTELCRPFAEFGTCKYGDKCQFAHGRHELRSVTRHPKYKTDLCRTYHTVGFCPYGPRCHFIHNLEEARKNNGGGNNSGNVAATTTPAAQAAATNGGSAVMPPLPMYSNESLMLRLRAASEAASSPGGSSSSSMSGMSPSEHREARDFSPSRLPVFSTLATK